MEASLLYTTVGLAKRGDLEAFLRLEETYAPALFEFLYRRTGDIDVAHDLVAEVMIRAYERLHHFHPDKGVSFDVWLLRQTYIELYDHYRDHAPHISEDIVNDIYIEVTSTTGFVPAKLTFEHLNTLLAALHSWQAMSFDAFYFMNKPVSDIAYILNVREAKVLKMIAKTKKHISEFLGFHGILDDTLMNRITELTKNIPLTRNLFESVRVKHIIELSVSEGRVMHTSAHARAMYHLVHLRYQPSNKKLPLLFLGLLIIATLVVMGVTIQYSYPGSVLFAIDKRLEDVHAFFIRDPSKQLSFALERVKERLTEFAYIQTLVYQEEGLALAKVELESAIQKAQLESLKIIEESQKNGKTTPVKLTRLKQTLDQLQVLIENMVNKKQTVDFSEQDHIFDTFDIDGYLGR